MGRKKVDYSGQEINGVRLNKRIEDYIAPGGTSRPLARYDCTCLFCQRNYESLLQLVKNNKFPGCGCLYLESKHNPRPDKRHDITGQRFGRCVAIKRLENGKWLCLCDCGEYFQTSLGHLTTGHTKSCGCFRVECTKERNLEDLTGQTFNELTVISYSHSQRHPSGSTSAMWLCLCTCGAHTIVNSSELKSGGVKSCGHISASYRETKIKEWLISSGVMFTTEYKFEDLKLKRCLRFDFAIFDQENRLLGLIEHHGRQHYEEYSKTTKMGQLQREVTDKMKEEYCKVHKIKLHIIRFDENISERLNNIISELHVNTVPSVQKIA